MSEAEENNLKKTLPALSPSKLRELRNEYQAKEMYEECAIIQKEIDRQINECFEKYEKT